MAHVSNVDDNIDEVLLRAASLFDQLFDVLLGFMGLPYRIVASDIGPVIRVLRTLPAQPYDFSRSFCYNGLTMIIVEHLFVVGVRCVKRADTSVAS